MTSSTDVRSDPRIGQGRDICPASHPVPIGQRFGDIDAADDVYTGQIGDRPPDPQNTGETAGQKTLPLGRLSGERFCVRLQNIRIAQCLGTVRRTIRRCPFSLTDPRKSDPCRHHRTHLAGRRTQQLRRRDGSDFNDQINPVRLRPANPALILLAATS